MCGDLLVAGWHADHVIPWSAGGPTDVVNGQSLCGSCNLKKGKSQMIDQQIFDGFKGMDFVAPSGFEPRDWQSTNLEMFSAWLKSRLVDPNDPMSYLVVAGVGSGKTIGAALMGAYLLNNGTVHRIVYVAPNKTIIRSVKKAFSRFGIDLVEWSNQIHKSGEPRSFHGNITTYQSVVRQPELQRALLKKPGCSTAVFFDEIHHLGDDQSWGEQAKEAFGPAKVLIGLSGTPFRTDNQLIPFVEYENLDSKLKRYKPNFSYPLGSAVFDNLCRKPFFEWLTGSVQIDRATGAQDICSFDDDVNEDTANMLVNGAVDPKSTLRLYALRKSVEECRGKRKLIIFVGGDSTSDEKPTIDASETLPSQLASIGVSPTDMVSVTSKTKRPHEVLAGFGSSQAWILICVNMASEGVDIPELSAALFLTSVTAKQTTIQRIGRILRMRSTNDPIKTAIIYMFKDSRYVEYSKEIENEILDEIKLRSIRDIQPSDVTGIKPTKRTISLGIGEGRSGGCTFNGQYYTQDQLEWALEERTLKRFPNSPEWTGIILQNKFGSETL